ncbi:hypothetical protein A3K48_00975 [candidate division WOR-1 bacterium RIFOXYA12_FULL_52_29]|uniref:Uncharacterized protein n=1 Tax=candidate division WOR-1 bacterium RIFOXYC12_FULL_54_18 TaxID=1802584 RepID=A0A1F4T4B0_UNCSA|nr:MAG: hypothetical protein A3K44_00975 [candidate division WOR-1 bacterium RIFOXYA2_FULL_51_19]OGC17165.1 MAG: hypothetical protein A3K48_00975 [candidate division WOR-1 bacterium RIFOXYA12_FULL_52_29]OGC26025.1 MAG: hypothetical protein A3K32_00970 [candidate division WOR-1 bacterium RIFOXYB2_FULL_45_9]OGC27582.1 MAG: hypothetical protein A3K49_00975 [candidate division WOR-1 bacterium RIFOXYC12_FULL_54_18]OGC29205.1 MAG: hypothetical protein A2346_00735 [candidate division WOR-1 bacterium R
MGDMDISGFGGGFGALGFNPMEEPMNSNFAAIEQLLNASSDITQNLLDQTRQAEQDFAKFKKNLDEKRLKEALPQLVRMQARIDNLLKQLDSSSVSLTPAGSDARRTLGIMKAQVADLEEQARRARPAGGAVPQDPSIA